MVCWMKKMNVFMFVAVLLIGILIGCGVPGAASDEEAEYQDVETESASSEKEEGDSADGTYENGLPKDEEVTLQYGFFEGGLGRDWVDYAIETFEEKYPNVTIQILASPDISQVLSTRISAGD